MLHPNLGFRDWAPSTLNSWRIGGDHHDWWWTNTTGWMRNSSTRYKIDNLNRANHVEVDGKAIAGPGHWNGGWRSLILGLNGFECDDVTDWCKTLAIARNPMLIRSRRRLRLHRRPGLRHRHRYNDFDINLPRCSPLASAYVIALGTLGRGLY